MFNPTSILVPTDFSKESDMALATAVDLAEKYKAKIEVLHVLNEIEGCVADYCIPENERDSLRQRMIDSAKKKLDEQIGKIPKKKGMTIDENIRVGNHVDEIVNEVDEKKIDLLVTAPHEHHKPWHLFFSHLTDELAKKSKCETLLLKH
jgi:nucleotide-binding universal stress UspA family protein